MGSLFTILVIIGCVGLILFILIQNPKGGGLNSEFGSAVQLGGAKRATDILEKGTWGLAIGIALICLIMARPASDAQGPDAIETEPPVENNMGQGQDNVQPPAGGGQTPSLPPQN